MEPITHFLTGACIGRAGLNRKTAYATLVGVLAAEAADIDVLWGLRGPVEELKHHRGITHTFIAAPLVAAAAVGAVWLWHYGQQRWSTKFTHIPRVFSTPQKKTCLWGPGLARAWRSQLAPPQVVVRWWWLYLTALLSALSHLLLDWSNNYGVRPFFPFNPRWYAGSFMFIAEPVLWVLLLLALIVPWLLSLADNEIGVRRQVFRGRGWAIFALVGIFLIGSWRFTEHALALALVNNRQVASEPVTRVAMEPYPINLFRWHGILETADFYQTAEINNLTGAVESDAHSDVLYKPSTTAATEAAKRTPLGQVYLDWGAWAVVRDMGKQSVQGMNPPQLPLNRQWTTVQFTDLRFAYDFLSTGRVKGQPILAGWVYIVDGRDDAGEAMNGRQQR
jgi:inner membrane protein